MDSIGGISQVRFNESYHDGQEKTAVKVGNDLNKATQTMMAILKADVDKDGNIIANGNKYLKDYAGMSKDSAIGVAKMLYQKAERMWEMFSQLLQSSHKIMMRVINQISGR